MDQVTTKNKWRLGLLLAALFVQPLYAAQAENPEIDAKFRQGMQALSEEKLKSAVEAFKNILSADPSLNRVKLELALSYYRSLRYEKAQQLAKEVLDDPLTPPEVRVTILAFLAQVRRDSQRYGQKNQFTPHVSLGIMHDSNINVGPSNANIRIGDITATLDPDSVKQSGNAGVFTAGLNHLYQFGKRVEIGERTGMLVWQTAADMYWRLYHDYHDYDIGVMSVSTGPAVLLLRHWRASLQLRTEYLDLGHHPLGWFHSINPAFTWQLENAELTWDATYTHRYYNRSEDTGREGDYMDTGLSYGRYLYNRRVALTSNAHGLGFFADDDQYGYKGFKLGAGISTETYPGGSAYARASYGYYDYDGPDPTFDKTRKDKEYVVTAGISHKYNEPTDLLKGWVANLYWQMTRNDSNISSLYGYRRYQGMLSISRNF